jgi:predicted O-methyltransferase YrrM
MIKKIINKLKQITCDCLRQAKYGRFFKIKAHAKGMLKPEAYAAIYHYASLAESGAAVEIGSAQGAGTISLGLGRQKAGSKDLVYAYERSVKSGALQDWNKKEANIKVLEQNLADFGLQEQVIVIPENVHHAHTKVDSGTPLSMIVIDSDGAIDRVFQYFYNQLKPGAAIVIDDYEDKIKVPKSIAKQEGIADYLIEKEVSTLEELCPLGKHYTTWKLTNYLIDQGYLIKREVIGNTFFGIKPQNALQPIKWDLNAFKEIRHEILKQYESHVSTPTT